MLRIPLQSGRQAFCPERQSKHHLVVSEIIVKATRQTNNQNLPQTVSNTIWMACKDYRRLNTVIEDIFGLYAHTKIISIDLQQIIK